MSERIVATDGHEGHWYTGEEIVRCRDCKWSRIHDGKSYPGNRHKEYVGKTYCIVWGDGMQGEWTNPNGYCHRGERRGA